MRWGRVTFRNGLILLMFSEYSLESLPLRQLARTPISSPKGPQGPCFAQFDAPSRGETRDCTRVCISKSTSEKTA